MKIVLYGAESTGKTSLAQALAKHFNTEWVPEYAREYLQRKYDDSGKICGIEDLIPIAKGQVEWERKAQKKAESGLIFCDTNPYQTYYYGKAYFKNFAYPELWKLAEQQHYDFYFLTYIDTPWVADDLRDRPEDREKMHKLFENSLKVNKFPYLLLKSSFNSRLNQAIKKVKALKNTNSLKF